MPLLPEDFDERFLQCAPPALTAPGYLSGQETVTLLGMTEEGRLDFQLATQAPAVGVRLHKTGKLSHPNLESIHIDTIARQVCCTWKSAINIQGQAESFKSVEARIL